MKLAIDFGNEGKAGYGRIHKHGCRDLADPETLRYASGQDDITDAHLLVEAFNNTTGWEDYGEADIIALLAPCARSVAAHQVHRP